MVIVCVVLSSYKHAKVKISPVLLVAQFCRNQHFLECKYHMTTEMCACVYEMECYLSIYLG